MGLIKIKPNNKNNRIKKKIKKKDMISSLGLIL